MKELYDENGVIKNLSITYVYIPTMKDSSIWTVSTSIIQEKYLVLKINHVDSLPIWPDIGLIEKSGNNLQSLTLDMQVHSWNQKEMVNNKTYRSTLSDVLRQCPNLQRVCLVKTVLLDFGTGLELRRPFAFYEHVYLKDSLISPSFLSSMPSFVPNIKELVIDNCECSSIKSFSGVITIDMPDTEFINTTYSSVESSIDKFY